MMIKKMKGILTLFICISILCGIMPITSFAAEGDVASVTFDGNTEYYTTIDDAWNAAVALDTTAENKATIKLLADCTAENTLTNTEDYLVLDTNGKTLTTPTANNQTSFTCGICVDGGSLELIGNGTVTGVSQSNYSKAILLINGGKVTANGITIHNTGTNGSNPVRIAGGEFYLLDGHLITDDEYALYADKGKVYLYSGTLETGRTARMVTVNGSGAEVQICYSEQPLYFVMRRAVWRIIDNTSYFHLEDNLVMDLEYSDNPDGSDSQMLRNVTQIDDVANEGRSYLKIQTYKPSYLFSTNYNDSLLKRAKNDGITTYNETEITAVHFVDLADYDLTNVVCSDYSAKGDGSVKAWMDGTELYIGGYRKIIAGKSLNCAFRDGKSINSITGLDLLDTSRTTDMGYVFNNCGYNSSEFTLDLGDNFDTSNATTMVYMFGSCGYNSTKFSLNLRDEFDTSKVTDMSYMFIDCGRSCPTFTLDLGNRFDTSSVTTMYRMFERCGYSSTAFTTLDLSTFRVSANTNLSLFAEDIPVTKFIFGRGWRNATVAMPYNKFANSSSDTPTEIVGATKNLLSYDWASNNRTVTFTDNITYTITALAEGGGSVRGEGTVLDGESITLTAVPAPNGYSLEGWYEGDTKVCDTEEFVIEDASDDKTYTAKFIQTTPYYSILARVKDSGGQVSGGDDVPEGGSVTLIATPDAGYTFDGWYDGDTKVCDTEEFVVTNVTESKTYTARFARIIVYYTISAEVGTDGGGTVSGGGAVADGGRTTLTAAANDGYTFDGWYDGDTKVCDTTEFVVENITTDKTYTAKFIKNLPTRSNLFSMSASSSSLISKINRDGVTNIDSNEITAVHFVDLADYDLTNIPYSDYSATGNGSVKAWMDGTELYIGGYGKIIAGKSLAFAFMNGVKIDKITGLEMLDTSNVTDMEYMFYACGLYSQALTLDLGNNFDTSNVTKMGSMFYNCGNKSTTFTLNLGDKFDTSNVTDMSSMFTACGMKSNVFTLDLGNKFDTSKVTNMKEMFQYCGASAKSFTLNLGDKFDTTNVTDMGLMFHHCGSASTAFTLDLGNKFDTSNVTDMNFMFGFCGCNSSVFNLDLDDKFNTSKAANMEGMFYSCGIQSSAFTTLDLSKFTVGANTKLDKFAHGLNVKTFIFGNGWANASLPSAGSSSGAFYASPTIDTQVIGATENLCEYDWASDNRIVNGLKPQTYTVTANAETGGTVSGGSEVTEGESVTLTATANDGYTFAGWYDGDKKVCDTAEFTVTNVTANITYTAKFTKNQVVDPTPEPSEFDFTTIRTLRAKDIVVNHSDKTITMSADGNVKNVAVYQNQQTVIPGGTIKLADAKDAAVKQNSGSFYIMNNAGSAVVAVDITIGGVTKQYTLSVGFNEFVEKNLRMYQRKIGSTQKDIVYGTDVGYVAGNEIHITPNAGVEYIGLTKYQGTPGNYNGIITPVAPYPTYSTFEESTSSNEPIFVDWQGCIFVKRPTDGKRVEMNVNYTVGTETSIYKVIVDFTQEAEFAFSSIRSARTKNVIIDHTAKTITMDSDGRVSNIAIYKYQLGGQNNMQITLADNLNADVTQNDGSFYIKDNGSGTATVSVDITIGNTTKQYTLTVNFADAFDFTDIRTLRAKKAVVDHANKTITLDSDGIVPNIAVYKAQNDIIKGGSITLSDSQSANVIQNPGSFYIKDDGTGTAAVLLNIMIGKITKQYTLNVNFSDGFNFSNIRTLRASEASIDHDAQKITISADKGAKNVALYISQAGVINGGKLTITDEKNSLVKKNPGSYYIIKQDGVNESTISADITVGGKTKNYEITVCFAD